ncbi:2626_t:CDS:2 [Dentiscutata heterogama]|uniref:2626_t:CDS:1 n=1 Tax=Dentiscutata heterogama TaxID=1316150 RepID=A0ACA9MNQ9_9GLOM|nr:2626_t:CDS:2 [Dentiscutata heterogama]
MKPSMINDHPKVRFFDLSEKLDFGLDFLDSKNGKDFGDKFKDRKMHNLIHKKDDGDCKIQEIASVSFPERVSPRIHAISYLKIGEDHRDIKDNVKKFDMNVKKMVDCKVRGLCFYDEKYQTEMEDIQHEYPNEMFKGECVSEGPNSR